MEGTTWWGQFVGMNCISREIDVEANARKSRRDDAGAVEGQCGIHYGDQLVAAEAELRPATIDSLREAIGRNLLV